MSLVVSLQAHNGDKPIIRTAFTVLFLREAFIGEGLKLVHRCFSKQGSYPVGF